MAIVTIVPLRSPGFGKTRLADRLDADERAGLAGAMLADVVAAIRGAGLERIVLAASGAGAVAAGAALDLEVVVDPPEVDNLDDAVEHARGAATAEDDGVLIVQADLPTLTADDIAAVLAARTPVVVAPTADGGTSALLRQPGAVIPTCYGPDSARRHIAAAERVRAEVTVIERAGLRYDVDTALDLTQLATKRPGAATRSFMRDSNLRIAAAAGLVHPTQDR